MKLTQLIQTCRLKRWSLLFLCLASVLCVCISSSQAQENHQNKCLEYFTEIIEIQKFREMLTLGAEELIWRYEHGLFEKKKLDITLSVWHTTESELRQKVTKLYDVAYAEKCFAAGFSKEEK